MMAWWLRHPSLGIQHLIGVPAGQTVQPAHMAAATIALATAMAGAADAKVIMAQPETKKV
jgi:hypothetical protein